MVQELETITEEEAAEEELEKTAEEIEESQEAEIPDPEPEQETIQDTFAYAILDGIDWDNGIINITQLEAEPYQQDIGSSLELAQDLQVIRSVIIRKGDIVDEYQKNINLGQIPLNSEIGIEIRNNKAALIISQISIDEERQIPRVEMEAGETFIYAILEWADYDNKIIGIEQLINEPYEEELGPQLQLADGYQVQMSVVERHEDGEEEYIVDISLKDIPIGEEIGIIVNAQGKARAIVYNVNVE